MSSTTISRVRISDQFRKNTTKALFSIFLFIVVYLTFAILSVLLTFYLGKLAFHIFTNAPNFGSLILAFIIASFGLLISIFLFKFIFSNNKYDRSDLLEIDVREEPELKEMIQDIVDQVQTHFPKRVYLSDNVNASVFYDSTFWSMLLPIKKNLNIGLGLVNTVSQEELKAILAHEFGHFSQQTMKVGSYVYNVNRIIFNMLYENNSYGRLISYWSGIHALVSILVWIVVQVVTFIQWVLRKIYGLVNKAHSALSIEMEYHADEVAAHITGSQPLMSSLLRMDLANHSLNAVMDFYEEQAPNGFFTKNLYPEQKWVMQFYASKDKLESEHGFPVVTAAFLNKYDKSKLVIEDQWASHPATMDRIQRLVALGIPRKSPTDLPANTLFRNIEDYQAHFTVNFYRELPVDRLNAYLDLSQFKELFTADYIKNTFDESYNEYYNQKDFAPFNLDMVHQAPLKSWDEMFSTEMVRKVFEYRAMKSDIRTLEYIADKRNGIKSFDYNGIKYKRREVKELKKELEQQLAAIRDLIDGNDRSIFRYFSELEQKLGRTGKLKERYLSMMTYDKLYDQMCQIYYDLDNDLQFISERTDTEQIQRNLTAIEGKELLLKANIRTLLESPLLQSELTRNQKELFDQYLDHKLEYFGEGKYNDDDLKVLFNVLVQYSHLLNRYYFLHKKEILDYQVELEKDAN